MLFTRCRLAQVAPFASCSTHVRRLLLSRLPVLLPSCCCAITILTGGAACIAVAHINAWSHTRIISLQALHIKHKSTCARYRSRTSTSSSHCSRCIALIDSLHSLTTIAHTLTLLLLLVGTAREYSDIFQAWLRSRGIDPRDLQSPLGQKSYSCLSRPQPARPSPSKRVCRTA